MSKQDHLFPGHTDTKNFGGESVNRYSVIGACPSDPHDNRALITMFSQRAACYDSIACFLVTSAHLPVRCIVGFSAISLP